ncbi:MAG: motility protein A [Candidatus Sericytochromatia bacterium]
MSFTLGLLLNLVVVYVTIILLGATPQEFLDLHAFVIVVLGSTFASCMASTFAHLFKLPVYLLKAAGPMPMKMANIVVDIKRMADKARSAGLPALTSEIPAAPDDFARRGIKLLVAGVDSQVVNTILEADIHGTEERHGEVIEFFEAVGGNAPTFGLMGTVLGIVEGLKNLDDINALGHGLAVALMATLYGVFSANILWLQIAGQLKKRSHNEVFMKKMYTEGLLAIQAGVSSDVINNLMKAYVNSATRARIEGGKIGKKKTERHLEYLQYMNPLDQERTMAFMAEVKKETEAQNLGQDDVKLMLAELINAGDDKVLGKDFATEYMQLKTVKKLPKGSKRKRKRGGGGKRKLD